MTNNETETEVATVIVGVEHFGQNTKTKTAKKIAQDVWSYRGWIIKRWDNDYLNDPEIRGYQYNTYDSYQNYKSGNSTDIADTLRGAKGYIDDCKNREKETIK